MKSSTIAKLGRGLGDGSGTNVILLRFGGTDIVLDPDTARQGLGGGHGWLPRLDSIYHGLSRLTYILENMPTMTDHSQQAVNQISINTSGKGIHLRHVSCGGVEELMTNANS
jgi:hypothetical protein